MLNQKIFYEGNFLAENRLIFYIGGGEGPRGPESNEFPTLSQIPLKEQVYKATEGMKQGVESAKNGLHELGMPETIIIRFKKELQDLYKKGGLSETEEGLNEMPRQYAQLQQELTDDLYRFEQDQASKKSNGRSREMLSRETGIKESDLYGYTFYLTEDNVPGISELKPDIQEHLAQFMKFKLQRLVPDKLEFSPVLGEAKAILLGQLVRLVHNMIQYNPTASQGVGDVLGTKITGGEYDQILTGINDSVDQIIRQQRIIELKNKEEGNPVLTPEQLLAESLKRFGQGDYIKTEIGNQRNIYQEIKDKGLNVENATDFIVEILTIGSGTELLKAIETGDRKNIEEAVLNLEISLGLQGALTKVLGVFLGQLGKYLQNKFPGYGIKLQEAFPELRINEPVYVGNRQKSSRTAGVEIDERPMMAEGNFNRARGSVGQIATEMDEVTEIVSKSVESVGNIENLVRMVERSNNIVARGRLQSSLNTEVYNGLTSLNHSLTRFKGFKDSIDKYSPENRTVIQEQFGIARQEFEKFMTLVDSNRINLTIRNRTTFEDTKNLYLELINYFQ